MIKHILFRSLILFVFLSLVFFAGVSAEPLWKENASIIKHPETGKTRFIGIKNKQALVVSKDGELSDGIVSTYAHEFGVVNPVKELRLFKKTQHNDLVTTYRYQQQYKNIPVIGAELVATVNNKNQLNFMAGEIESGLSLDVLPDLTDVQARTIALNAVSKWYRVPIQALTVGTSEISIYKAELISPNTKPANVVWRMNVSGEKINELVFVDVHTGVISFHLSQIYSALNRRTYTANNTEKYQSQLICDETDPGCAAGDADAKAAHKFAKDTYLFYLNNHGRDGIDGTGGAIISSIHVGPDFKNAAWTGTQIIYGDGFSQADDVVAHELTHGVTERTSNLFYYFQSGAISESFSDLWGEFVDQSNSLDVLSGTDTAAVKWIVGEDVPGINVIRNMKNPPSVGEPDKMSSANYFTGSADNGGVHANSGINNKAVYLMTDGGNFNGKSIVGIGRTKVAKLYYEVQTKHLTSGSDYLDLYNALTQACSDLSNAGTLNSNDCVQVNAAISAVEMDAQPEKGFNIEASICPSQTSLSTTLFSDNIESGLTKWSFTHDAALFASDWVDLFDDSPTTPFATSGVHSLIAYNNDSISDKYARIRISLPTITTSENIFLHFKHALELEANEALNRNDYFDAAIIEYSTNNGTSWNDAVDLIVDGKSYSGIISNKFSNPLAGRLAYSSISNGFVSSRLNLSKFAGSDILLRWRVATDLYIASLGWVIDDIKIYTCQGSSISSPVARAGADRLINVKGNISLNGSASFDADANVDTGIVSYRWQQVGGKLVNLINSTTVSPVLFAPAGNDVLSFKLTVTDNDNVTDSDIVNVIINTTPTANAGDDFVVITKTTVTLDASASSDVDGSIVKYQWQQVAGDIVTLSTLNSVRPEFIAPAENQTLIFSLVVTDNDGIESSIDTVNVKINPVPIAGGGGCSLISGKADFDPFMLFLLFTLSVIHFYRKQTLVIF